MKKRIALVLALMLLGTSVLAGCKKDAAPEGDVAQNTNTSVNPDAPAITVKAPDLTTTEYDNTDIVEIDGKVYSAAMFRCMLGQVADSIGGTDTQVWVDNTIETLKDWTSLDTLCADYGVYLQDSDYEEIYNLRTQTIEQYDSVDAYYADLEMYHMTDAVYVENIKQNVLFTKFAEVFVSDFVADEQDILAYVNDQYVRVKHILVKTDGLDDSQKAEARSRAERVLERAKAGESFETLVEEISEDGMDVDLGYYFTYGKMVEPFETASFALEVNEISEIVESQFGYHIIKKYPMEKEHILADTEIMDTAKSYLCNEAYIAASQEAMNKAIVTYYDNYEEVKNAIVEEILAAKK